MKKNKEYYLNLPYEIAIRPLTADEGGGYLAHYNHKGLEFIMSDGESYEEVLQNVKNAFECYLDVALEKNDFIPEPNHKEKTKRINITLPERIIKMIDKQYPNRSAFLSEAALEKLNRAV
ncbi:MAG: type II toxin-antitoxin system HicB family antitoxin [Sulfurospirillaceae bacterium]|jgi:predicted RNase H-like HicB family nuclease|nr:type II toxin-antitoxin system HicB family antitoxin [Sulfurospirillaceae bacterium]MCK9546089.1 type II toxin-antitoxin system HicB family antitoxin [Sulfurospirillaceae bacterium]MDY0238042.1 type II toxin-antitoxin system HicB family antitoxin [Campylobacterales bacterium]NLM98423.1 type II toxin-antitoxin system HicB family antitoxin [Campylobacteraceae bacterium]